MVLCKWLVNGVDQHMVAQSSPHQEARSGLHVGDRILRGVDWTGGQCRWGVASALRVVSHASEGVGRLLKHVEALGFFCKSGARAKERRT